MTAEAAPIRVLIIEDNLSDATLTSRRVTKDPPVPFTVQSVATLAEAWSILENDGTDVVLADLNLPDSEGLDTLAELRTRTPRVPVVVLTGHDDESFGLKAVQLGAQDYLKKSRMDSYMLQRALLYAVERHRAMQTLRDLSLVDHLTKLYNRRGLSAVVGKRLELAQRLDCRAFVLFADVDDLKEVNDEYGHAAGDNYILLAAEAMKQSFRAADVVARVGGDEFVVFGIETTAFEPSILTSRVQRTIEKLAREWGILHPVSVSCGVERFEPATVSIEAAIDAADASMYLAKRARRESQV